jgi:hypothetical protein
MEDRYTVESLYTSGDLKGWIKRIGCVEQDYDLEDLEQDIYLQLLTNGREKFENIPTKEEQKAYLLITVRQNIHSKNSPYYYKYKRYLKSDSMNYETIEEKENGGIENETE